MSRAIDLVVSAILTLAGLVLEVIGVADAGLAALMFRLGLPAPVQIILLVAVAIWLAVLALQRLGRVFAALLIVLLCLLIIHRAMPGEDHYFHAVPLEAPGTVHT